jgi:hypothetical protein
MKKLWIQQGRQWVSILIVLALTAFVVLSFTKKPNTSRPIATIRQGDRSMPEVKSAAPSIEIKTVKVKGDLSETTAELSLELKNKSPKAVMVLAVTAGDYGRTTDNELTTDNPRPAIEPYGEASMTIPLANVAPGMPVIVSVIFADGTEEGDAKALKKVKASRKKHIDARHKKEGK